MSVGVNNNKETFKLLDLTSDTDSDNLQIEIVPRKRRINRSRRGRNGERSNNIKTEPWGQKAITIGITAALLAWLAALSWAAAALSGDTRRLDAAIREDPSVWARDANNIDRFIAETTSVLRIRV